MDSNFHFPPAIFKQYLELLYLADKIIYLFTTLVFEERNSLTCRKHL